MWEPPQSRLQNAIEPDATNAEVCRVNTQSLPNVTVVEAAFVCEARRVSLSSPEKTGVGDPNNRAATTARFRYAPFPTSREVPELRASFSWSKSISKALKRIYSRRTRSGLTMQRLS
jgi:hypothetical protein